MKHIECRSWTEPSADPLKDILKARNAIRQAREPRIEMQGWQVRLPLFPTREIPPFIFGVAVK
jgi:hypothetical protein